jgi:hypothetical protein
MSRVRVSFPAPQPDRCHACPAFFIAPPGFCVTTAFKYRRRIFHQKEQLLVNNLMQIHRNCSNRELLCVSMLMQQRRDRDTDRFVRSGSCCSLLFPGPVHDVHSERRGRTPRGRSARMHTAVHCAACGSEMAPAHPSLFRMDVSMKQGGFTATAAGRWDAVQLFTMENRACR